MTAKETIDKLKELLNLSSEKNEIINLAQIARVEKWYIEVENNIFAVGNKVIQKWWDNETQPLGAGEYQLENGEKMMVDSSGIITSITAETIINNVNMSTETKELQTKLDLEIAEKDTLTKEVEDLKAENEKLTAENEKLKAEIEKLKAEDPKAEEPKAELSEVEKLSKIIEDLSVRLAEVEKKPAVETVEKDLTKLSYEDRMWILHNKQN